MNTFILLDKTLGIFVEAYQANSNCSGFLCYKDVRSGKLYGVGYDTNYEVFSNDELVRILNHMYPSFRK